MFKRILVPLDGSARAARVVPVAARIARAACGSVILVTIVNHFVLTEQALTYKSRVCAGGDVTMDEAEAYLEDVACSPALADVLVETAILSGPIASTLLSAAATYRADLIVLSSHATLGCVTEKVISRAIVPVLLLRETGPLPLCLCADEGRPVRVLVALNGTSLASVVLNPAAELAAALAAPGCGILHLTRVVLPPEVVRQQHVHGPLAVTVEEAQRSLMAVTSCLYEGLVAPTVARRGLAVTWAAVESEQVAMALVHIAERGEGAGMFGGCDIIAMATHGLTGLPRFALGSVVAQVMALTNRPVLLMRPAGTPRTVQQSEDAFFPNVVFGSNHVQSQA